MHADGLFDILDVIACSLRQIFIFADTGDIAAPAGHSRQDRLRFVDDSSEREIVSLFAVYLILRADGNLLHIRQHIQLRERNLGRALNTAAIARGNQIDGTNSARTARGRAVFAAGYAQLFGLITEPFRRERALAYAGGIRLDNADRAVNMTARNTGADAGIAALEDEEEVYGKMPKSMSRNAPSWASNMMFLPAFSAS